MAGKSILGFYLLLLLAGCAQMVTPSGGPKDVTPPKVVSSAPENKSTGFSSKKILIKFNEYIQLKDLNSQLVVSPPLKYFPITKIVKGKELELELKDTLLPNTTYTFNFGNAIADNNEGNVLANFKYVFSTGSYLDSLKLLGTVRDAFSQDIQKDALVMLYADQNDSAPYKKLPSYCGHTDANGNYLIENIKEGTYRFVTLSKSQNGYFYHPYTEGIAFNSTLTDLKSNDTVNAFLFTEEEPKLHLLKTRALEKGKVLLVFNKPADSLSIKPLNLPFGNIPYTFIQYSITRDTATYWLNTPNLDSLRFILSRNGKNVDTAAIYSFPGKSLNKKPANPVPLKISSNVYNNQYDFDYHHPIVLKTEHPILKYNLSHVFLTNGKDTIKFTSDSSGLPFQLNLNSNLISDSTYRLFILPKAFTDIFGSYNDTLIMKFKVQEPTYFGSLKLNLRFAKKGSYIIQLLDGGWNTVMQEILSDNKTINYDALPPGTYRLRAIEDINGDGKWTTGNYLKKLQPEKIYYFNQPISIRSNWDLEEPEPWLIK
jgi:hypothetical protein